MKFKIVGDSCTDLLPEDLDKKYMVSVPLTIDIGGYEIVDDETFNQEDFLRRTAAYADCPKSACPSPDAYMNAFEGAGDVYVITLSGKLSGSYNSALLAKNLYIEDNPDTNIHIFDSKSAAAGQYLIAKKIEEYALANVDFGDIVEKVTKYVDELKTVFVLESLEALRKNGRLSNIKATVANVLSIKPYMEAVDGIVEQVGQTRGIKKALNKMIEYSGEIGKDMKNKVVAISHCNCYDRALEVKNSMMEKYHFKDFVILDTKGISSLYASDGGIIVAF